MSETDRPDVGATLEAGGGRTGPVAGFVADDAG